MIPKNIFVNTNNIFVITNKIFVIKNKIFFITNRIFVITNNIFVITNNIFVITNNKFVTTNSIFVFTNNIFVITNKISMDSKKQYYQLKSFVLIKKLKNYFFFIFVSLPKFCFVHVYCRYNWRKLSELNTSQAKISLKSIVHKKS